MKRLVTLAAILLSVAAIAYGHQGTDVSGNWNLEVDSAEGVRGVGMSLSGTLSLAQEGTELSGTWTELSGNPRDVSGSVDGNAVTLEMKATGPRSRELVVTFDGTVESERMSGTVTGRGVHAQPWAATRSE